jgi:hypothetical protein
MSRKRNPLAIYNPHQVRTIVSGTLVGAIVGTLAGFLLTRRAARKGRELAITPMEGIQIGALVFGLLRAISALGDDR